MNPRIMWGQICAVLLVALGTALSRANLVVLILGAALVIWWLLLNTTYAAALGVKRRSDGSQGPDRVSGDHHVAAQAILLSGASILAGLATVIDPALRATDSAAVAVCLASALVAGIGIYASSLVDWYYVRPRLDGIVREPPCRSSREETWMTVTRRWYRHRAMAELTVGVAIVVGLTALVAAFLGARRPDAEGWATLAAIPFGSLLLIRERALLALRDYAIDPPRLWLGDLLTDPSDRSVFYLLHVGVRGPVTRERDEEGTWQEPQDVPFREVTERRFRASAFEGCQECSLINPRCEWRHTKRGGGRKKRLVL